MYSGKLKRIHTLSCWDLERMDSLLQPIESHYPCQLIRHRRFDHFHILLFKVSLNSTNSPLLQGQSKKDFSYSPDVTTLSIAFRVGAFDSKKNADHGLNKLMEDKKRDNDNRLRTGEELGVSVRQGKAKIVKNPEKHVCRLKLFSPIKKSNEELTV